MFYKNYYCYYCWLFSEDNSFYTTEITSKGTVGYCSTQTGYIHPSTGMKINSYQGVEKENVAKENVEDEEEEDEECEEKEEEKKDNGCLISAEKCNKRTKLAVYLIRKNNKLF